MRESLIEELIAKQRIKAEERERVLKKIREREGKSSIGEHLMPLSQASKASSFFEDKAEHGGEGERSSSSSSSSLSFFSVRLEVNAVSASAAAAAFFNLEINEAIC